MPRKNSNAGQPNREAQMRRMARRRQINEAFRQQVRGPLSENLTVREREYSK